ncbi:glycosyltransferase family protein [Cohnella abietis]|uniref:Glycosyl transferase n=1 Tax=Cohnella abietis TaxID=2507935 RepID=A0A3T1DDV5_9BACL|nr:group 1 glycosyl transferase [Cohnella abietis]BBI36075.1 hypothetical protein KCTCHS21_54740 [Cohnella abietis]
MFTMCTIVAKNYLAFARTLVQSFLNHHPTGKAYVLLADESEGFLNTHEETFEWVHLKDIGLPEWPIMRFQYNITEFSTAVKPFFLDYLLRVRGLESIVYFDPDILITHRMDDFYRKLPQFGIVLTPHILTPLPDDHKKPEEVDLLQSGVYNLGFIALSRKDETMRMLQWWKERLLHHCIMEPSKGYHVDQRWMDMAPALFEGVHIHKDPTYNVAYWNLHERPVVNRNGLYEINGKPLTFYHFSGLVADLSKVSQHQTRFEWAHMPDLLGLFREYVRKLLLNGYAETAHWRYAYNYFDNGVAIPAFARIVYRKHGALQVFGNPFLTLTSIGFYQWLFSPTNVQAPIPQLLREVYETRVDLQRTFPYVEGADRINLMKWSKDFVPLEYGVDPIVWNPVLDSMYYR